MSRPVRAPYGAWPLEMQAETAAAYCDEPSVDAFLAKVPSVYPEPARSRGMRPKWHRHKLDQIIAKRHGLTLDDVVEDAAGLI